MSLGWLEDEKINVGNLNGLPTHAKYYGAYRCENALSHAHLIRMLPHGDDVDALTQMTKLLASGTEGVHATAVYAVDIHLLAIETLDIDAIGCTLP